MLSAHRLLLFLGHLLVKAIVLVQTENLNIGNACQGVKLSSVPAFHKLKNQHPVSGACIPQGQSQSRSGFPFPVSGVDVYQSAHRPASRI